MEILGNKTIRNNGVAILRIKNSVFKMPFNFGSIKEMTREKKSIKQVKSDIFFSKYLPKYRFFLIIQILPYLSLFCSSENNDCIKEYFKKAFQDSLKWEKVKLEYVIKPSFLEFVKKYAPNDFNFFCGFLNEKEILLSSAHGDFHKENILFIGDELRFIDWSRYSDRSSRYFDFCDYCIFSNKKAGASWIETWKEMLLSKKIEMLEISISKEYLLYYGIWKASNDLEVLRLRNRFDNFKIKKYLNFIKIFKELSQ